MGSLARRPSQHSTRAFRSVRRAARVGSLASVASFIAALAVSACSGDDTVLPLGVNDAGNKDATASSGDDAGVDATTPPGDDAGSDATSDSDAGATADAGARDATSDADAASVADATVDAGADAATLADAASADASDASSPIDAGPPTFTNVYASVMSVYCVSCHGRTPPSGNLQMGTQADAYANLVNVAAAGPACGGVTLDGGPLVRVVPNDVADSLLAQKVLGTQPCGNQMPLDSDPLSPSLVGLIEAWISAGAPND